MTTNQPVGAASPAASATSRARWALPVLALVVFGGVLGSAGPALADVPVGWSDPEPVSYWQYLWIFFAAPLLMFVVVGFLAWLPGLLSGEKVGSGGVAEDAWFGGSPDGPAELAAADGGDTGGASGRW